MKTRAIKILALILTLVMLISAVPVGAFAQGEAQSPVTVDNGEMEVKATSTFGSIISRAVKDAKDTSADDYRVSALDFSGKTAAAQYKAADTCTLIVAIYNEETQQMLSCATEEIYADDNEATVSFDIESMPVYFMAKAYIVDSNGSALCDEFVTMQYTKAFETEFKDVTIDDFKGQDVINLDESKVTNFAVMSEESEKVISNGKTNVLKSDFLEDESYIFENIDSSISSLKPGDIFHYDNGDETQVIVIKVKSITINGTTAVIVADDTSVDEVFDYVKIDESDEQYEMHFRPNYDEEAVTRSVDVEDEIICDKISYQFGKNGEGWKISNSVKVTGSVSFECGGHVKFYYDRHGLLWLEKYFEIELSVEPTFNFNITITAEMKDKKVKEIGEVDIYVCPGLYIAFKPAVVFKASASLSIGFTAKAKYGFIYNNENDKWINISEPWSAKPEIKIEGKFFFGLDMSPHVVLIHKKVAEAGLTAEAGLEVSASMSLLEGASASHTCEQCLDGDINMVIELSAYIKLVNGKIKNDFTLWNKTFKILDFYFSFTYGEFGFGECPHSYRSRFFGSYPQSRVTDSATLSLLNSAPKTWYSYNYMSGAGTSQDDGSAQPSDYMQYCDVTAGKGKYRGVKFSTYRPVYTNYKSTTSTDYTSQDDNGYKINTTYWFKYEPLKWRVLDPSEGLVLCENIIDSQAYSNTFSYYNNEYRNSTGAYASDYESSSIREWLNDEFYNTAFDSSQQSKIKKTHLENKSTYSSTYDSADTDDKVFLLSYWDAINTKYGFSSSFSTYDINRRAHSTDYAKCQGVSTNTGSSYQTADGEDTSCWRLRSPIDSYFARDVGNDGYVDYGSNVGYTDFGIRPALKITNLSSLVTCSAKEEIMIEEDDPILRAKAARAAAAAENTELRVRTGKADFDGVSGNRYMLYTLKSFDNQLELSGGNITFVGQGKAVDGKAELDYYPADGITVIVGDFGNGTEVRIASVKQVKEYSVTWIVDGVQTVEYLAQGEPIYAPIAPEKEGYTFKGWTPSVPKSMPGADMTFTAVYEKNPEPEKAVRSVSVGDVTLNYKQSTALKPNVTADDGVKYTVKYESSNPKVARVDNNGNVYAAKKGTAEIKVTVTDENNNTVTDTCKVTVKYSGLQWFIIIVLFGWIWYLK